MSTLGVVKVGGSLFDLPDLGPRLRAWLAQADFASALLIPGGGAAANAVRELDRVHGLGEEKAHWLALRALTLNAYFLADLLPEAEVVTDTEAARRGRCAFLDCYAFARADEASAGHLPHAWSATSDALAARVAAAAGAGRLVLLKSVTIPASIDWDEAARRGWVDPLFPGLARGLNVSAVNFRQWGP